MNFSTSQDRMQHPQAKLIPQIPWNRLFEGELPDSLIPLMQDNDERSLIDYLLTKDATPIQRKEKAMSMVEDCFQSS